ncbi:MAG: hypothetical protein GX894_04920 [Clostridia bacterium]|nr:hypothetical protein [Clostridia bacterium]
MKRIIAFLTAAVMILVLSPVANAAPDLDLGGNFKTKIVYEKEKLTGKSELSLETLMGGDLKAGLSITGLNRNFNGPWENGGIISVDKMWLETHGPLFPGTSSFVTRIGGLGIAYSPYTAIVGENGISVDQINLGPASLGAFYAWDGPTSTVQGARLSISPVDALKIQGSMVKADQMYYDLQAQITPADFMRLSGVYATEETEQEHALKVDAAVQVLRDLQIRAGYRDITENFSPKYGDPNFNDPKVPYYVPGQKGLLAGATFKQPGLTVEGTYTFFNDQFKFEAVRTLGLGDINFDAVLEGVYRAQTSEMGNLEAGVRYKAPNGLNLEVGYDFIVQQPSAAVELQMTF